MPTLQPVILHPFRASLEIGVSKLNVVVDTSIFIESPHHGLKTPPYSELPYIGGY